MVAQLKITERSSLTNHSFCHSYPVHVLGFVRSYIYYLHSLVNAKGNFESRQIVISINYLSVFYEHRSLKLRLRECGIIFWAGWTRSMDSATTYTNTGDSAGKLSTRTERPAKYPFYAVERITISKPYCGTIFSTRMQ